MSQATLTHSDEQIRLVAAGLVVLTTTDVAAEQLRRVYGEDRAGQALAPLAAARWEATGTAGAVAASRPDSSTRPARPVAWTAPRAIGPGRRGTRRTDWL